MPSPQPQQIVFATSGSSNRVFSTTAGNGYVITSKIATSLFTTVSGAAYAKTSSDSVALFATISGASFLTTSPISTTFFVTPDPNTPRELILKIGDLEIQGDYTFVDVPDATGNYVINTNDGGYNVLPAPYNPYRPYRDNLSLWTVYRIWNVYGQATQSPDAQDEAHDVPYVYPLAFPTTVNADGETEIIRGIYEIILIGAPYFDENNSGGTYVDDTAEVYHLINGTDTNFEASALDAGDYLYYVSGASGELLEVEQVDHIFDDTTLNLIDPPVAEPTTGSKLYGSATAITGMVNSGGYVYYEGGYEGAPYYLLTGVGTQFVTNVFDYNDYIYYVDSATGNYILMGRVLETLTETTLNLYQLEEGIAPTSSDVLVKTNVVPGELINSGGTYDSELSTTIYGTGTDFNLFSAGQTLYYQEAATKLIYPLGVIDSIISDVELILQATPIVGAASGDRLFASNDPSIAFDSSGGVWDSTGSEQTFYTLKGLNTLFQTNFLAGDTIYIVAPTGEYSNLGQVDLILSETEMVFYTPNSITVNANDWIWGNASAISLIDISGTFDSYQSGNYYNVEGTGTSFLTAFLPEQYLFYLDSETGNFVEMGKIFEVYDDTNVWLYEAPSGNASVTDTLYSSYSLNTETADYSTYNGLANLYEIAQQYPGWYVTSVGILIDELLVNCITRMRYEFLLQVMCGKCPDEYLETYAIYVGMLNAMDIQDWTSAVTFYNKLKEICAASESSCGC